MRFSSCSLVAAFISSSLAQTYKNATHDYLLSSGYLDLGDWADAYTKAKTFVSGLTTAQKLSIITGGSFDSSNGTNGTAAWTALVLKDGMESVQGYFYVSTFSQSSALAMTWDRDAIYAQAKAVGTEFYLMGIQIIDGPTSQPMGRSPWGGRQGEAFGVDSYLNGVVMGLAVQGTTDAGVIAGGKHYILNEQETNRQGGGGGGMGGGGGAPGGAPGSSSTNSTAASSTPSGAAMASGSGVPSGTASAGGSSHTGSPNSTASTMTTSSDSYSSNADDKTLHETYLFPFYNGVKAGMGTVMCAMNRVNSTYACENSVLLQSLLKTELGFPGYVNPDVSSQKTALGSANGGLDQGSSSTWSESTMATLLSNGSLTQERFDDMAIRNAMPYFKAGMDNGKQPSYATSGDRRNVRGNHSALIRENGAKSLVLLKNNGALPLKAPNTMAIFGSHAGPAVGGPNYGFSVQGSGPIYEGHLATGSGSGQGSLGYVVDPHMALVPRAAADGTFVRWILNNTYSAASSQGSLGNLLGSGNTAVDASFLAYAADTDVCICFINALQGEGADRTELRNTVQDDMVLSVAAECNNTIVVIQTVGPRLVDSWIENENVTAVLYSSLLGQESGNSIVDVLYGDVNPSGRLAYTIAKNESDYNCVVEETNLQINYTEGNYIDYKYFDKYNVTPRYAFGHGLSYTTFNYSSLNVTPSSSSSANTSTYPTGIPSVGGNTDLWTTLYTISLTISNTGPLDGAEVAQLYVSFPDEADKPVRELRGFERVVVEKGGEREVTFELMRRDLSYWNVGAQQWALAKGTYGLSVGASSRDLRSVGSLVVA